MKTRVLSAIFVLTSLISGCESEELSNLEERTDPTEQVEETEEESTDETQAPGEVEEPEGQKFGQVSYQGRIPTASSKVPSCKTGTPDTVIFVLTDATGITREESVPATENNGLVSTSTPATMPLGQSTVNEILLMQGNDTLYAIPDENDLDLARYAEITVPFEVEVVDNTELTGDAFCYTQEGIDVPDDTLVDGGFGTQRLQTLWIDVQGNCIDIVTVTIDAHRVLEIYPFQEGLYDIPIPENYDRMDIRAYTPEFEEGANDFKVVTFTASKPYNEDGLLNIDDVVQFSYDCPVEEFPDDEDF